MEGMRRIELRCVAETWGLKGALHSRGKQTSVAYSAGAAQLEPEQVPPMLINGGAFSFTSLLSPAQPRRPELDLSRRSLDEGVALLKALKSGRGHSNAQRLMLQTLFIHLYTQFARVPQLEL